MLHSALPRPSSVVRRREPFVFPEIVLLEYTLYIRSVTTYMIDSILALSGGDVVCGARSGGPGTPQCGMHRGRPAMVGRAEFERGPGGRARGDRAPPADARAHPGRCAAVRLPVHTSLGIELMQPRPTPTTSAANTATTSSPRARR